MEDEGEEDKDGEKNEEAYAELIQVLDDESLSSDYERNSRRWEKSLEVKGGHA